LRAEGPGRPGTGSRDTFYVVRARGRSVRVITVLDSVEGGVVRGLRVRGGVIEVETASGVTLHTADAGGWQVTSGSTRVRLAGARAPVPPFQPLLELDRPTPALGAALRVGDSPPLGGPPGGQDRGGLRVHGAGDFPGSPEAIRGAWRRTPQGYCVTLALAWPEWQRPHVGGQIGFDLIVNEMLPGRLRRGGQLVWSGGDGWVYLR